MNLRVSLYDMNFGMMICIMNQLCVRTLNHFRLAGIEFIYVN